VLGDLVCLCLDGGLDRRNLILGDHDVVLSDGALFVGDGGLPS
jgi:hypothetical protein